MSSVDNRLVAMKFDNAAFERGASVTMNTLSKLKDSLNFTGANQGMADLQDATGRFNLSPISNAVGGMSKSFIGMSTVAITALANITSKAVDAGTKLVKSLTLDPIKSGFTEYETNLNSVQTILANTSAEGAKLKDVNGALGELNKYSDKTIYNFSEMARNIGTFTAAGVKLDTSVNSIKGIANLAALSGSTSEQASTAMYQLSQSIAAGKVGLQDWNSVVNAGMGGKTFQDALYRTGKAMGSVITQGSGANKVSMSIDEWTKSGKSFRESLQSGWLTSEVLTQTLEGFTGDLSDAQLKSMGYTQQQIKEIQEMAKTGQDAATKVKTFTQLIDTLKEGVGSGWAQTWQLIIGDFDEAKEVFGGISSTIGGMISKSADARNKVLGDWKKEGGRLALIDSVKNSFNALMAVIKPIKEAFREVFPPTTGKQLADITKKIRDFTAKLTISEDTAKKIKTAFKGLFSIFSIIKQVLGGVIGVIWDFVGSLSGAGGGFLDMAAKVGAFLTKSDDALEKGQALTKFFDGLSTAIRAPLRWFGILTEKMSGLFSSFSADKVISGIQSVTDKIKDFVSSLGDVFSGDGFDGALKGVQTGLFGGLVLLFANFAKKMLQKNFFGEIFGESGIKGMTSSIASSFDSLGGTLKTLQTNVKADTLMKIAIAVGVLTLSIVALAFIDGDDLKKSLTAIGVAFGELLAAMTILTKISGSGGFIKIPAIATGLILLATAILVLSLAVKVLSTLSWAELTKGLTAIAVLLAILAAAVKPLAANASGMIRAGAGILILGVALKVLASAVKDFAEMNLEDLRDGLIGVAATITAIAIVMRTVPKNILVTAVSIGILAVSLRAMAEVVKVFGSIDLETLKKGLTGISGSLIVIGVAMRTMPKNMIVTGAGLLVVSFALQILAKALESMGGMTYDEIAKGLLSLAGSLAILALGLYAMTGTVAGAAALLLAAGALAVLTPILLTLSKVPTGDLVKGLLALAAVFVILGVAGAALTPLSPVIFLLGVAILAIGGGLALAGLGALAFATALGILVTIGGAAVVVLAGILTAIVAAIPLALKAIAEGVILFAKTIAEGYPAFVAAMTTILLAIIKAIINIAPKVQQTFLKLLNMLLNTIVIAIPRIVRAGLNLIAGFLKAIADNVYKIVTIATKIITEFIRAIGDNAPKVANEAADTIIKFVNAAADAIDDHAEELGKAGGRLATSIIKGMVKGLAGGAGEIAGAAKDVAKGALNAAKDFLGIDSPSKEFAKVGQYSSEGFAIGLTTYSKVAEQAAADVGNTTLDTMKSTMAQIADVVSSDIDMTPVIAPVLDLTQVQQQAGRLNALLPSSSIQASVSSNQASTIAKSQEASSNTSTTGSDSVASSSVVFEQNIYSPKALDSIDVYRNTRNQLALAKEALTS